MTTPNQKNILIFASQQLRRASQTDAEHQLNIAAIEEAFELLNASTRMATALENLAGRGV
jgi:hypothetical protein